MTEPITTIYWLMQTATEVPAADDWLTAGELATAAGLRVAKRRNDWRLGRWTAKRAVAAYLRRDATALVGSSPRDRSAELALIEIRAADDGAPEVVLDQQRAPLSISLSHSAGLGLCAVGRGDAAIGCDVERIEPHSAAFIADFFAAEEQAAIARVSAADKPQWTTLLWSAKESALKALREGLRLATRSAVVTVPEALPVCGWRPLSVRYAATGEVFDGCWRATEHYLLTLVAFPGRYQPQALRSP